MLTVSFLRNNTYIIVDIIPEATRSNQGQDHPTAPYIVAKMLDEPWLA